MATLDDLTRAKEWVSECDRGYSVGSDGGEAGVDRAGQECTVTEEK